MWKRNLLFLALVLGAAATLWANLLPPRIARPRATPDATPGPGLPDREIIARVNETFRGEWSARGLSSAKRAPELAVLRRLALALTGTIPSLEEVPRFEAQPAGGRGEARVEERRRDRPLAQYLAARLPPGCGRPQAGSGLRLPPPP